MDKTYVFDGYDGGCCRNNDPMAMAAMMNGGMNNQWNNPFIYLVWLIFAQRFMGNGWDGNSNPQLDAIRTQMQDNQNSGLLMDAIKGNAAAIGQLSTKLGCDFNTLNSAICDVRGGIDRLSGQVGFSAERVINAVNMGDFNLASKIQECCCENRLAICNQTNTLQNAINGVAVGQERGFSSVAYETQRQTCDILGAIDKQTQAINAQFCAIKEREDAREIQNLRDQVSQYRDSALAQNTANNVVQRVNPTPIPAYWVPNVNGCVCNNYGYPYNGNGGCCNNGCGC